MSNRSPQLEVPTLGIYLLAGTSAPSSSVSFLTTDKSETSQESPIPYDEICRDQTLFARQPQSPTALLQRRARSRSLGMMSTEIFDTGVTPSSTPPTSVSVSARSSIDVMPSVPHAPIPSYEESVASSPRLRQFPSLDTLHDIDDQADAEADAEANDADAEVLDETEEENFVLHPSRCPVKRHPDEGREVLPEYSCSVFRSAILHYKLECVYPGLAAKKREWIKVYAVLFGTVMRLYSIHPDGTLSINFSLDRPFRDYTLQYAEAGIATDYLKKRYVLRVRAEGEQFLMQCSSEEDRDNWVETIQSGSSIALALEDRNMPKIITLPRRRRGRYSTSVSRSRPTLQRIQPTRPQSHLFYPIQSAPIISRSDVPYVPQRTRSAASFNSDDSGSTCNGEARHDPYLDAATALALCLDAGRSRPPARERILIPMLTARQHRQHGYVIISGLRRKIDPKTNEIEDEILEGIDPVEDEHRGRLLKSRRRLSSRLFNLF